MTTINKEEIQKFSNLADEWWDVKGKFKPLHMFNPIRIEYITEKIKNHFNINKKEDISLGGLKVLDIGCGGGLISEPMARLGASVTGIDASEKNIQVAKLHSEKSGLEINYMASTAENLLSKKELFDVILNMEVIEHVPNPQSYLHTCSKLLKKNGLMTCSTINRNYKSYLFAIIGAEYVLKLLPKGTHQYEKFIKPSEITKAATKFNLQLLDLVGLTYNPITKIYKISKDVDVNYMMAFKKSETG